MRKSAAILIIFILTVSSLIMLEPAFGATKPSVPEFTLNYADHSYDVPPTYSSDPYTGKQVMTNTGGHVENKTLEITIKNQPFTSTKDASGNYTSLYYDIRFKGHYEDEWKYYPVNPTDYGSAAHPTDPIQTGARGGGYLSASLSDHTVATLSNWQVGNIPSDGEVDVQVQALIGHDNKNDWGVEMFGGELITYYFEGESSDWSSTQTILISTAATPSTFNTSPANTSPNPTQATLPSQNPTAKPEQPGQQAGVSWEQIALVVLIVVVAVQGVVMFVFLRKRSAKHA
jgi:hypothetical protein